MSDPHPVPPTATLRFDSAFIREGMRRRRRHHPSRGTLLALKAITVLGLASAGAWLLQRGHFLPGVFFLVLATTPFLSHWVDEWVFVRAFSKSPLFGQVVEIQFREDGLHSKSASTEGRQEWSAFTRYIRCADGFLLLQGANSIVWIPEASLAHGSQAAAVDQLLRTHVPT